MLPLNADELLPWQLSAARRVLDYLDVLDAREARMYASIRRFTRRPYRAIVEIVIDAPEIGIRDFQARCFAHSLSRGGISLIYPAELPVKRLTVVLTMPDESRRRFNSAIVRTRHFQKEGFWEFGLEFMAPAAAELLTV